MDYIEITRFTQEKRIIESKNRMYNCRNIDKIDSLRLMVYACKTMYGLKNTTKILHGIGIENINLSEGRK